MFTYDITEIDKVSKIIIELIKQKNKVLFSGPMGSGKTTLIRIINQILLHDSGKVFFNDHELNQSHIKQICYLPE